MSGIRFDVEDQVCVNQAFTATAVSAHSIQKTATKDISIGRLMAMVVVPKVAAAGGAAYTLQAIQADNTALTTNQEVLGQVAAVDADLVLGQEIVIPIPQGTVDRAHLGFKAVMTGGTAPTVTLDVYLVPQDEIAKYKSFPKAVHAAVN